MAESSETGQGQQPGATVVATDCDDSKLQELEELKKLLAAKDAEIAALKAQNVQNNDTVESACTTDQGNQNKETKRPPKLDVTLSIRGTPEFDSYPYSMASDKFFYMASIKAPYFREDDRAPIDLVAVVDESGSMSGDRIKLVRETVKFIIKNLEHRDRFGIIGYSSGSRKVLPLTLMDAAGKRNAEQAASNLKASGGTALCQGLVDGVKMMRERTIKNEIASVMILTDGQANQGPTSASRINACVRAGKVDSTPVQDPFGAYNSSYYQNHIMNSFMQQPPLQMQIQQQYPPMQQQRLIPQLQQMQVQQMNQLYAQQGQPQPQGQSSNFMQQNPLLFQGICPPQGQSQPQGMSQLQPQGPPQYQDLLGMTSQGTSSQGVTSSAFQPVVQGMGQNVSAPLQRQIPTQGNPKKVKSTNVLVGHPPAPGPAPVLQQAQGSPPKVPKIPPPKEDDDDDSKQPEGGDDKEGSDELPCTINTFGFGANHNAQLMKALAENGRGMYAFIENTDQIADTFAECLGGLVSIVGQNLKVQVQALNNVEINRCLVKGFSTKVDIPKKKHTILVKDLQSEENRDFIFELKVPRIEAEKKEDPLIQLSVHYENVVKGTTETLTNICNITRIDGKQIGERNVELDQQYNRVIASDAMEEAEKLAKNGKLKDARNVLTNAERTIKSSKTFSSPFCSNLVQDMGSIRGNMMDFSSYQMQGQQQLAQMSQCQQQQRSYNCGASPSLAMYSTSSRSGMRVKSEAFRSSGYFG